MESGGDTLPLSDVLGHSQIHVTKQYCLRFDVETIRQHWLHSPLGHSPVLSVAYYHGIWDGSWSLVPVGERARCRPTLPSQINPAEAVAHSIYFFPHSPRELFICDARR